MSTVTLSSPPAPVISNRSPRSAVILTTSTLVPIGHEWKSPTDKPAAAPTPPVTDPAVTPDLTTQSPAGAQTAGGNATSPSDAVAPAAEVYAPLAKTQEFLRIHPQIDFDTQLVEVRTTGVVSPDRFHRQSYGQVEEQKVDYLRVVRRSDDHTMLGHVGGQGSLKFTPCQNAYLVDCMVRSGMFDKMDAVRVESLKRGALVMIEMEAKDDALWFETPSGVARLRMGFWNGHSGNHTVCAAPLINMPRGGDVPLFTRKGGLAEKQSIRHTRSVNDTVESLSSAWGKTMDLTADTAATLRDLGAISITRKEMEALILSAMTRSLDGRENDIAANAARFQETLLEHTKGGTPETLLDLADAVAAHVDYDRPMRSRKSMSEDQARAESSLIGAGARLKNAVMVEVLGFLGRT